MGNSTPKKMFYRNCYCLALVLLLSSLLFVVYNLTQIQLYGTPIRKETVYPAAAEPHQRLISHIFSKNGTRTGLKRCSQKLGLNFRSAYMDFRARSILSESEMSIVALAEVSKTLNRSSIAGCIVMTEENEYITQGRVVLEYNTLDAPRGWIQSTYPFLTHEQTFLHCIIERKEIREASNRPVLIKFYRTEHSLLCEGEEFIMAREQIGSEDKKSTDINVCMAVYHSNNKGGFPVAGMVSNWLEHHKNLGVTRVMLYVSDLEIVRDVGDVGNITYIDKKAIADNVDSGFVKLIHWPSIGPPAFWHGDGKTFYWSQILAYNDCVYRSASRNRRVSLVDFDDYITKFPKDVYSFTEPALLLNWIMHHVECVISHTYNASRIWEKFERNSMTWENKGLEPNTKSIMNSWKVLDTAVHSPARCTGIRGCYERAIDHRSTGVYMAHLRAGFLSRYKYKCRTFI